MDRALVMSCGKCGTAIIAGSRFCGECGAPVGCASCGHTNNPPHFKFCSQCGASLSPTPPEPVPAQATVTNNQATNAEAERRQLTLLFTDLVGSTALSELIDEEELRDVIRRYQNVVNQKVTEFGGTIARFMGDGSLAYFCYPHSHEDNPERAVNAALQIVTALQEIDLGINYQLQARQGIDTGLVVVGDLIGEGPSEEWAVVGCTPNRAARLQGMAQPNEIVVSDDTYRLVRHAFDCRDLGPQALKGISKKKRVWRVEGHRVSEDRFGASHDDGLGPLIGRSEELQLLYHRWEKAKRGEGQIAVITGEPGIGKSRIVHSLRERLEDESAVRMTYQCSPYHTASALHPVIQQLTRSADFRRTDSAQVRRQKLCDQLSMLEIPSEKCVALFCDLLSIPVAQSPEVGKLGGQERRQELLRELVAQLRKLTQISPVLVVFEDVHWIDPTSQELLDLLVDEVASFRALILITARTGYESPWFGQPHVGVFSLNKLNHRECVAMIGGVAGGRNLPQGLVTQIVERTDGIPLFVEEFTKSALESDALVEHEGGYELDANTSHLAIPATLLDSLRERLDKLNVAKQVAQVGAVLGREMPHDMLVAVSDLDPDLLSTAIQQLVDSQVVYRRGSLSSPTYVFKHALVRDAAYEGMLRSRRRQLHARIADVLVRQFPEISEENPEVVAQHYAAAEMLEQAISSWIDAGHRATGRSANMEAAEHFRKGAGLVESLPDSLTRKELELSVTTGLGAVLIYLEGPGSPVVRDAYIRACELQLSTGGEATPCELQQFAALWGQWRVSQNHGEALRVASQLLELAEQADESDQILQAHHALWPTLFFQGEFESSCQHVERGLLSYQAERHRAHAALFGGHDTAVCGYGQGALAQWMLGNPAEARQRCDRSLSIARSLEHAPSVAHAMDFEAMLLYYLRDAWVVKERSEQLALLSREHDFPDYHARAVAFEAWSQAVLRGDKDAPRRLSNGLDEQCSVGTVAVEDLAVFLDMLAESYACTNALDAAGETLDKAMSLVEQSGVKHWLPSLWLRKAHLMQQAESVDLDEQLACLGAAVDAARAIHSPSLELRAALAYADFSEREPVREEAVVLIRDALCGFESNAWSAEIERANRLITVN